MRDAINLCAILMFISVFLFMLYYMINVLPAGAATAILAEMGSTYIPVGALFASITALVFIMLVLVVKLI